MLSKLLLNNFFLYLLLNDSPNFKHNINKWNSDSNICNWPDLNSNNDIFDKTSYILVNNPAEMIRNMLFPKIFWIPLNNIQDSDIESVQSIKSFKKFAIAAPELYSNNDIRVLYCLLIKKLDDFTLIFYLWCEKKYIKYNIYDSLCKILQFMDHLLIKGLIKQLLGPSVT